MTEIVSRAQALQSGLKRYFTGEPCKNGHVAERGTASRACLVCGADKARAAREADDGTLHARELAWQRERRRRNPAVHIAEVAAWQKANPEKVRANRRRWKQNNPDKVRADRARRRLQVRTCRCDCCAPADFEAIYKAARLSCCEVDHRTPLALGGLHCCKNLQLLTVEEHAEKTSRDISIAATLRHAARRAA